MADPITKQIQPPKFLGKVGRDKWRELVSKLNGKPFERDAMALLCKSWENYLAAQANIDENGITYTDTNNGRTWNNPAINTADLAHKQIVKLSKQLGLWDGATDDGIDMPE